MNLEVRVVRLVALMMVVAVLITFPFVMRVSAAGLPHPVLIIGRPSSVTITSYLPTGKSIASNTVPTGRVTVTAATTVASLARLANRLNPTYGGAVSCPMSRNAHARLVFSYANGDRWTIEAQLDGCGEASAHGTRGWIMGSQADHPQKFFQEIDRLVGFPRA
jgi:hypothetical protein